MEIKKGTEDQGWDLVDKLDELNRGIHPHSGTGTNLSMAYVVKKGDQVVGGIEASSDDHAIGYVEVLWIDDSYRRKGLGCALLTTVEHELRNAGCKRVRLETFDYQAPAFYQANGYREFAKLNYDHADLTEYFFVKELQQSVTLELLSDFSIEKASAQTIAAINDQFEAYNLSKKPLMQDELAVTFTFLAEEDGQCIGGVFGYSSMYRIGYIESLWVAEEYRHNGIGTELVNELVKALRDFGCPTVHLDTMSYQAPEFYQSQGFKQFGKLIYPESGVSELFFVKHFKLD
ncbi:GNAT family N-acetyltransferase [Lacticaseibacillus chiayiensis]|uniref:GNAT family N-acetyltransferase n=1 Tax=Lacticaseibacillus chiayiensis TaxID=2100821 RepID=UPI003C787D61